MPLWVWIKLNLKWWHRQHFVCYLLPSFIFNLNVFLSFDFFVVFLNRIFLEEDICSKPSSIIYVFGVLHFLVSPASFAVIEVKFIQYLVLPEPLIRYKKNDRETICTSKKMKLSHWIHYVNKSKGKTISIQFR